MDGHAYWTQDDGAGGWADTPTQIPRMAAIIRKLVGPTTSGDSYARSY